MTAPDEPDTRPRCPTPDCHSTYPVIEDTPAYERDRTGKRHYCTACRVYFGTIDQENTP